MSLGATSVEMHIALDPSLSGPIGPLNDLNREEGWDGNSAGRCINDSFARWLSRSALSLPNWIHGDRVEPRRNPTRKV